MRINYYAGWRILIPFFISANLAAQPVSIKSSSIAWEDQKNKTKLLENAAQWPHEFVQSMFDVYHQTEHHSSLQPSEENIFNLSFIHHFWGPINNPFGQYSRPTKLFLFIGESDIFYLVPLIQDTSDNNYYVFDHHQMHPMLLNDWVAALQSKNGAISGVQFNLCNSYGSLPTDSCLNQTYQQELRLIEQHTKNEMLRASTVEDIPSAYRNKNESWLSKHRQLNVNHSAFSTPSIYQNSVSWSNKIARSALLESVTAWPNFSAIQSNFEKIRDIRYFQDEKKPAFLRRISWLYPDDGCWTRVAAVVKDLFGPLRNPSNQFERPSKIFAFGDLCATTSNSPDGKVTWWYHTAPIVKDAQTNQVYVLDPSINPYQPLTVENWILKISSNTEACAGSTIPSAVSRFAICSGYGISPYDSCQSSEMAAADRENAAVLRQSVYRLYERHRQVELNRDPDGVLGPEPPWLDSPS